MRPLLCRLRRYQPPSHRDERRSHLYRQGRRMRGLQSVRQRLPRGKLYHNGSAAQGRAGRTYGQKGGRLRQLDDPSEQPIRCGGIGVGAAKQRIQRLNWRCDAAKMLQMHKRQKRGACAAPLAALTPRRIFSELGRNRPSACFLTLKISWGSGKAAGAKPPLHLQQSRQQGFQIPVCPRKRVNPVAQNCTHLHVKIGVVLGQCPDRKDQMRRITVGDFASIHPCRNHGGFLGDQCAQIGFDDPAHPRRALQNFIGEQAAFTRVFARKFQFSMGIGFQFCQWIAQRVDGAQRVKPCFQ